MEQRENPNGAMFKDARIMLSREEFALGMEQRLNTNDAALKGAQIIPGEEEYVRDTVHIEIPPKNLQLSHHVLDQSLRRLL
jgi:hypothetical protein